MRTRTRPRVRGALMTLAMVVALAAASQSASAQAPSALDGNWATRGFGSIVQFRPCANDAATLCGRIVWIWEPNDERGRPRVDNHNPDRALRTRSLVGVEIVRGLRETSPGVWSEGALYNPDDGRTYTGTIRIRNGALELRGCALSVFCQTQIWRRPEDVFAAVQRLPQ